MGRRFDDLAFFCKLPELVVGAAIRVNPTVCPYHIRSPHRQTTLHVMAWYIFPRRLPKHDDWWRCGCGGGGGGGGRGDVAGGAGRGGGRGGVGGDGRRGRGGGCGNACPCGCRHYGGGHCAAGHRCGGGWGGCAGIRRMEVMARRSWTEAALDQLAVVTVEDLYSIVV